MKDNRHIDQMFRQKLEHFEKQPAAENWNAIEHAIQGKGYSDRIAKGFALLGLLAFLYVGYDGWVSSQSNQGDMASMEEMIDFELKKEAFELEALHSTSALTSSKDIVVSESIALVESTEIESLEDERIEKAIETAQPSKSVQPARIRKEIPSVIESNVVVSSSTSITIDEPYRTTEETNHLNEVELNEIQITNITHTFAPLIANEMVSKEINTTLPEVAVSNPKIPSPVQHVEQNTDVRIPVVLVELDQLHDMDESTFGEAELVLREWTLPKENYQTGFYTGTIGSGHNSWILNNNAEEAAATQDLDYKLDFGVAYGLIAGYDFSKHWGIEAEWIINSKQGQKYENNYILSGVVMEEEVDLNYMHFPVLVKYKNDRYSTLFRAPRSINVLFGPQYSVVQESTTSFNNGLVVIEELVNTKEFGMSLGLEYNVSIKDNLDVGLGARSSISTDIKMFPRPFSTDLEKSNNLLIGLNAGIRFYPFKQD